MFWISGVSSTARRYASSINISGDPVSGEWMLPEAQYIGTSSSINCFASAGVVLRGSASARVDLAIAVQLAGCWLRPKPPPAASRGPLPSRPILNTFTRWRSFFKLAHVAVNILGVSELLRRADGIAEHLFRRGNGIGRRQMIHQFRDEERLGSVLPDLGRVAFVEFLRFGRRRSFGSFLRGRTERNRHDQRNQEAECRSHDPTMITRGLLWRT